MIGILLPEVVIYNTLKSIVKLIRDDLIMNDDVDTILYSILGIDESGREIKMNNYNFFKQAKKIFEREDNLSINFGYNQKVAIQNSLHILLPGEEGKTTIGSDEGYVEEEVFKNSEKIGTVNYLTQTYNCVYQIMITSNNSSEVNLIYNVLKSILLMLFPQLEVMGIRNLSLSGKDVFVQDDLTPIPIFHKVINLSFFYEHNVPELTINKIAKNFIFNMNAKTEE